MLKEERVYWHGHVEACSIGLLWHWLNFSTAWCTIWPISLEKDWKHVLTQKVVTLNTAVTLLAWHSSCHTSQLVLFRGIDDNPQLALFRASKTRLKECNKPSVWWKSSAIHKLVWSHFQVGWAKQSVFFWDDINNQKYVWIIPLKITFWGISQGKVATSDRRGGQI